MSGKALDYKPAVDLVESETKLNRKTKWTVSLSVHHCWGLHFLKTVAIWSRLGPATALLFSSLPAAHWESSAVSLTLGDEACNVRSQQHNTTVSRYSLSPFSAHLAHTIQSWRTYSSGALEAKSFLFCFVICSEKKLQSAAEWLVVFPHVRSGHSLQQTLQANRLQGNTGSSSSCTRRSAEDTETGENFMHLFF